MLRRRPSALITTLKMGISVESMSIILRVVSAASCPHIVCPTTSTTSIDRHECFSVFHHMQKDKQRKQRHSLKLGKKRRESSKRNYYIISRRVTIKAIIIVRGFVSYISLFFRVLGWWVCVCLNTRVHTHKLLGYLM